MLTKDQFADNHFIRTIIEDDLKTGAHAAIHPRAQRLPAHRTRQIHLPEFRLGVCV